MKYHLRVLLNNAHGEPTQIEMYEKHVLDFLCDLHTQAINLECQGNTESGRRLREMISRLMNEFENWQKSNDNQTA